jgi:hypothetical protein
MRSVRVLLFLSLVAVGFLQCASPKKVSTEHTTPPKVITPSRFTRFTVTLSRGGGFSGLQEKYEFVDDGSTKKASRLPGEAERVFPSKPVPEMVEPVRDFLNRHYDVIDTLDFQLTGNMTTSIILKLDDKEPRFSWPNLDPPRLETVVLDSLYQLMLEVQSMMSE